MCNLLHYDSKPIPAEGIGYKVFYDFYRQCFSREDYSIDKDDWIRYCGGQDGFCFFLTKKEAMRMLSSWRRNYRNGHHGILNSNNRSIRKIAYRGGLGKAIENNLITNRYFTIALCKEFKILETGGPHDLSGMQKRD